MGLDAGVGGSQNPAEALRSAVFWGVPSERQRERTCVETHPAPPVQPDPLAVSFPRFAGGTPGFSLNAYTENTSDKQSPHARRQPVVSVLASCDFGLM